MRNQEKNYGETEIPNSNTGSNGNNLNAISKARLFHIRQVINHWKINKVFTTLTFQDKYLKMLKSEYLKFDLQDIAERFVRKLGLLYQINFVLKYEESPITNRPHFHVISDKYIQQWYLSRLWQYGMTDVRRADKYSTNYFTKWTPLTWIDEIITITHVEDRIEVNQTYKLLPSAAVVSKK